MSPLSNSDPAAGSYGAPPAEQVASDARNLVRDWFPRQMPPTGFVDAGSPAAPIPGRLQSSNVTAPRRGGRARRVVAWGGVCLNRFTGFGARGAGSGPSAVNVPMSPSSTVAATAPAAAASNGPGGQTKDRFMILTITKAAAAEPAAIPNIAVARPSARYSSA